MTRKYEIIEREVRYQGFFRLERYRLRHELFSGGMSRVLTRELFERGHAPPPCCPTTLNEMR